MKAPLLPFPAALREMAGAWRAAVVRPRARAAAAVLALAVVAALLVARHGTPGARAIAAAAIAVAIAALAAAWAYERWVWREPGRALRRLAGRIAPDAAAQATRAMSLLAQPDHGTSRPLAELHVARSIGALPRERIARGASRVAFAFAVASLVLAAATLGVVVVGGWAVVEGADVLVARRGVAPIGMPWVDLFELRARPPDYLHEEERAARALHDLALPRGTLLTFRGVPVRAGRRIALSDGRSEVPFVDDGAGNVVARWPVEASVQLRVVARFGDVVIEEPEGTAVTSIEDDPPVVHLEGAPKQIRLAETPADDGIPIRYDAVDDHGLREVHLVLRSGTREERRVLARLDGETRADRGGHVLRATDGFLKASHAPVDVRVEAKDNDPITGPKWGASESLTILPPDVGEPEARRLEQLARLRDRFVDGLAARMVKVPEEAAKRRDLASDEKRAAKEDDDALEGVLGASYAGARVPRRLQAILRGQMRKVREAVDGEAPAATGVTHGAVVRATERLVLVVDAIVHGLGQKDARDAAKQLADVAEDLALGASQAQRPAEASAGTSPERAAARMDASVAVLGGGGRSMLRMGALGRDLGEIVDVDLKRVARARSGRDFPHAELAARDLATRLREPDPSFGARGRSGHAGGESGGGRGAPGDEGEGGDEVEQAFDEAAQELEQLAMEHAGQMGQVEQALGGVNDEDMKQLGEEAKKHAEAVRQATQPLPSVGAGSDSWTSKGAAAREHGEQMARSLEQGRPADAVASGRSAIAALDEAKRVAARERFFGISGDEGEARIDEAKKKIEPEVRWAEQALEDLRKKAADRAGSELQARGNDEEKLADRAREIGSKGRDQGALPEPALESLGAAERALREAARALRQHAGDKGLDLQREAQRELERAREALGAGEGDRGREGEGDGDRAATSDHADIPTAEQHKGPDEFRRRVTKGLTMPSNGRYKDALRRYAEGLLR